MTDDPENLVLVLLRKLDAKIDTTHAELRDAIDVLTAMSIRHEGSIQSVVRELQAIHRHNTRTSSRLRKLEGAEDGHD